MNLIELLEDMHKRGHDFKIERNEDGKVVVTIPSVKIAETKVISVTTT